MHGSNRVYCNPPAPPPCHPLPFRLSSLHPTVFQGVAHHYAGEEGTLPQLAKLSDEFAHTTFFPNLLLHSAYQTIVSGPHNPEPIFG